MMYLSLRQAAEALGVSPSATRKAADRGTLRVQWIGQQRVVTELELERYRRRHLGNVGRPRSKGI